MVQLASPDEAAAILAGVAFEPVVGVLVVEHLDVLVGGGTEAILHRHIVEERLFVLFLNLVAGSYLAANLHLQAVVPEALGKLERVVGVRLARGIHVVVEADADVNRLQGAAGEVVDFAFKEGTQRIVHH